MVLLDIIHLEQELLEIQILHESNKVQFKSLQDLLNFNKVCKEIGEITQTFFDEMQLFGQIRPDDEEYLTSWSQKLLSSEVEYNSENAKYFLEKQNLLYLD